MDGIGNKKLSSIELFSGLLALLQFITYLSVVLERTPDISLILSYQHVQ